MTVNLEQIVFDASDAAALATFWAALLEQPVDPGASAEFASVGRTGPLPLPTPFLFMHVPEERAGKNRVHVDLDSATPEADVARAMKYGAQRVDDHDEDGTRWTTLADTRRHRGRLIPHRLPGVLSGPVRELDRAGEHLVDHRWRQPAGEGVLLAHVVATQHGRPVG
jgi:hypothetical protein